MRQLWIVTARCEDGRVYYNSGSWHHNINEADRYDHESEAAYAAYQLRLKQEQDDQRWLYGITWKKWGY